MPGPLGEACGLCLFFEADGTIGTCRRYAPSMLPRHEGEASGGGPEHRAVWPITDGLKDWCGEFKPHTRGDPPDEESEYVWRADASA